LCRLGAFSPSQQTRILQSCELVICLAALFCAFGFFEQRRQNVVSTLRNSKRPKNMILGRKTARQLRVYIASLPIQPRTPQYIRTGRAQMMCIRGPQGAAIQFI